MSTIKVNTLEEATAGGATYYTAKAWVNWNGTGTVAVRGSGGVSSITDNSTGIYTVNYATAEADANYSLSGIGANGNNQQAYWKITTTGGFPDTANQYNTAGVQVGSNQADHKYCNIQVIR